MKRLDEARLRVARSLEASVAAEFARNGVVTEWVAVARYQEADGTPRLALLGAQGLEPVPHEVAEGLLVSGARGLEA